MIDVKIDAAALNRVKVLLGDMFQSLLFWKSLWRARLF